MNTPIFANITPLRFHLSKRRLASVLFSGIGILLFTLLISSQGFERFAYRITKAFFGSVMRNMGGIVMVAVVAWLLVWAMIGVGCYCEWLKERKKDAV